MKWSNNPADLNSPSQTVGFGGGCYWCTEAVFLSLKGVSHVTPGWIQSVAPDNADSEAVLVTFCPQHITLKQLIEVHLSTHSSTGTHTKRKQYRSAVYAFNPSQLEKSQEVLDGFIAETPEIITRALPFARFKASKEQYHNYYYANPSRPFCENIIAPKLTKMKDQFEDRFQTFKEKS